jgi:hypothetical protein
MARQRKNPSGELRLSSVIQAGVICSTIVVFCLGYVWQKQQINKLADQIRVGETRLARLRDQNDKLRKTAAQLVSPAALDFRVQELHLGLVQPQQSQIWRLPEPALAPPAPTPRGIFAAQPRRNAADLLR